MYRSVSLDVQGSPMQTLIFEPDGPGPHPGLVIAQHRHRLSERRFIRHSRPDWS